MKKDSENVFLIANSRATNVRNGVVARLGKRIASGGYTVCGPWWVGDTIDELGWEKEILKQEGERKIVVAGGDGTVNTVVNRLWKMGVLDGNYQLIHAALGAFNVYKGTYSVECDQVVKALGNTRRVKVDLQEIMAERQIGEIVAGVGLLGQGIGASTKVIEMLEEDRDRHGKWPRSLKAVSAILKSLKHQRPTKVMVQSADDQTYMGTSLFTEVVNGPKLLVLPVSNNQLGSGLMTGVTVPAENTRMGIFRAGWVIAVAGILKDFNPDLERVAGVWQKLSRGFLITAVTEPLHLHTDAEIMGDDLVKIDISCHKERVVFSV